jgi:hypothetical protein
MRRLAEIQVHDSKEEWSEEEVLQSEIQCKRKAFYTFLPHQHLDTTVAVAIGGGTSCRCRFNSLGGDDDGGDGEVVGDR